MKMTLKKPFYVSTPALIILQILTIKKQNKTNKQKTYQSSAWRVSREMTFFYLLSIMGHHAHLVPSQVSAGKRSTTTTSPPTQQEQDATTTSNLHLSKAMLYEGRQTTGNWQPDCEGLANIYRTTTGIRRATPYTKCC